MSRIYDNQPLTNLPVVNIECTGTWHEEKYSRGNGFILEAVIQNRAHFCVNVPGENKRHYYIFYVKVSQAHRRQFTDSGQEVEPNFSETKKVSTGFLNSSYKVTAKGQTDKLKDDEIRSLLHVPEVQSYTEKGCGQSLSALWCAAALCDGMEFETGDNLRIKTKGDGPFIASLVKVGEVSSTVSNYAGGESVGASWTDKIMDLKPSSGPDSTENDGVDEDEWDD